MTDIDELRTAMGAPARPPGAARRGRAPKNLDRELIRALRNEGYTYAQIARAMHVGTSTVRDYANK